MKKLLILIFTSMLLTACARPPVTKPELALEPVSWWRAGLSADDLEFKSLSDAARRSLEYYKKLSPETSVLFGPERITIGEMSSTIELFISIIDDNALSHAQKIKRIKDEFVLLRSVGSNNRGKALFTGYYEPLLSCRRVSDETYQYPLFRRPDDIIEIDLSQFGENFSKDRIFGRLNNKKVVPYYTRQEIDHQKALHGKALEILWCSDPVDIYFLQIQGSGKAELGDGEVVSVLYDGQNGRPYRSIGRHLIDIGAIQKDKMSMRAIREYLRTHPDELFAILNQNPSYVFFKLEKGPARGSIGAPLTPGRSIATDYRLFPKGALGLICAEKPVIAEDGSIKEWTTFTRFVLNQDTGGAIRGPGRVDLFWGEGAEAAIAAGYMQQEGKFYFLMRKKAE